MSSVDAIVADAATASTASQRTLGLAAVGLTVVTWGCSNVVIKLISTSGLVASFYRLWLAIPLLWVLAVLVPGLRMRLTRRWLRASLSGGALFALHQVLFFTSLKRTSVVNVSIIGALQPALVLLVAGRMFGERSTAHSIGWSLVAVAGTAVVVAGGAGAPSWAPAGDVLAVFNLFAFTAYFLASKQFRSAVGAFEYVLGMTTVAGVLMLGIVVVSHQALGSPQGRDWALLLFLAVFPGTLGHVLTNWAHPHVSAFLVSTLLLGVPVLAATGAAAFLGEPLRLAQIGGGLVVLAAIERIIRATSAATGELLAESAAETDAP